MHVTRLTLTDFRNYRDTVIAAAPGLVVLHGDNGAGKTNVLEALSLLAPGRGMRRAALPDMARQTGSGGFAANFTLGDDAARTLSVGTGMDALHPRRRMVRINGAQAAATSLGEWLSVLWLTPAMDRLFTDPAGNRRRFLDRMTLALYPGHAHHSARYDAAMRARTKLLADGPGADNRWLSALEAQMAQHGVEVDAARRGVVAALSAEAAGQRDGPFARPGLSLVGPDLAASEPWPDADALARELAQGRVRDAAAGRALAGPHRQDLAVVHVAKGQPAALCSTGEQKALLLSLVLAHGDCVARLRGSRPLLLLDEVAAHLDPMRREALFLRLTEGGGQVWMTGTEAALFDAVPDPATRLEIDGGRVITA